METFARRMEKWLHPLSNVRIQILSDLHLEVGQQYSSYTFPTSAPFLLLGGDIGRLIDYEAYLSFLEAQTCRYEKVFLILGNHEFYGLDYDSGINEARRLAEEPSLSSRLILLHKSRWDDPGSSLTILGCTLWSEIPEAAYAIVESKVSDFKKIHSWSVKKHNEVHEEEIAWLRQQVAEVKSQGGKCERRLLIATHHAPCIEGTSQPQHSSNPWTPAFATDLLDQESWTGVKIWAFGHTHFSTNFMKDGIRLVANQRGYVLPGTVVQKKSVKPRKMPAHEFDENFSIRM